MAATAASRILRPNPGPQEAFLASPADIAIYGGAAGGGKTWALLVDPLRWTHMPQFRAVFFRRTYPQITEAGGPWDQAVELYPPTGARARRMDWIWPSGARVEFRHIQRESDVHSYDGAQIAVELFDELAHFSARQFWYLQSRLRTLAPMRPYLRASTNPTDPDHWLYRLISWWIADDGFPDPSRAGVLRWFVRDGDELLWADSPEELERYGKPTTLAFYPARLEHNPHLLEHDPEYINRLRSLPRIERERLLLGNWHVRPVAGAYFQRRWLAEVLPGPPEDLEAVARYWDRAATVPTAANPDPDWTAGVLMGRHKNGGIVVLHAVRMRGTPAQVAAAIRNVGQADLERWGERYRLGLEVDPGQAGVAERMYLARELAGLPIHWLRPWGSKEVRFQPFSAAAEAGNVQAVRGEWLEPWIRQLEAFPEGSHDDLVDATSGAYRLLVEGGVRWDVEGEEV